MNQRFYDALEENPVVAAVKDEESLGRCCRLEDIRVIFVLYGNICNISEIVKKIQDSGKIAIVHADLIVGLSAKEIAVDYLSQTAHADGIISTKPALIHRAKELKMLTVLRCFLIDSMALDNLRRQQEMVRPDAVEVLPGILPQVIERICRSIKTPVIAGGLITTKDEILAALSAGALAVSSTNEHVWTL